MDLGAFISNLKAGIVLLLAAVVAALPHFGVDLTAAQATDILAIGGAVLGLAYLVLGFIEHITPTPDPEPDPPTTGRKR